MAWPMPAVLPETSASFPVRWRSMGFFPKKMTVGGDVATLILCAGERRQRVYHCLKGVSMTARSRILAVALPLTLTLAQVPPLRRRRRGTRWGAGQRRRGAKGQGAGGGLKPPADERRAAGAGAGGDAASGPVIRRVRHQRPLAAINDVCRTSWTSPANVTSSCAGVCARVQQETRCRPAPAGSCPWPATAAPAPQAAARSRW